MNRLVKFFHELMSPHCEHCIRERKEELEQHELDREINNICNSCENLKMQLSIANQRCDNLIEKLTSKHDETPKVDTEFKQIIQTRHIPWSVKKQQLETESRLRAQELREKVLAETRAVKPDVIKDKIKELEPAINEMEKELGISNTGTENA